MNKHKLLTLAAFLSIGMLFFAFVKDGNSTDAKKIQVTIDNLKPGPIALSQLFGMREIRATLMNVPAEKAESYNVSYYAFAIAPKVGMSYILVSNGGSKVADDIKKRLANLKPGDLVIVGNVMATSQDGQEVHLPGGSTYTITE